jgi:hypothetical protein
LRAVYRSVERDRLARMIRIPWNQADAPSSPFPFPFPFPMAGMGSKDDSELIDLE